MSDLTAPIFDNFYIYPCIIPYICTLKEEDVAEYGLRTTQVPELDQTLDMQPTKVYLTIDKMIEVYRKYYPVTINDPKAAKSVYEAITLYLEQWDQCMKSASLNVNTQQYPLDDLLLMDDFASKLRYRAVEGEMRAPVTRSLVNILDGVLNRPRQQAPDPTHNPSLSELFRGLKARGSYGR